MRILEFLVFAALIILAKSQYGPEADEVGELPICNPAEHPT